MSDLKPNKLLGHLSRSLQKLVDDLADRNNALRAENTRLRTLMYRSIGYVTHGDLTKDQIAQDILRDYAAMKKSGTYGTHE